MCFLVTKVYKYLDFLSLSSLLLSTPRLDMKSFEMKSFILELDEKLGSTMDDVDDDDVLVCGSTMPTRLVELPMLNRARVVVLADCCCWLASCVLETRAALILKSQN